MIHERLCNFVLFYSNAMKSFIQLNYINRLKSVFQVRSGCVIICSKICDHMYENSVVYLNEVGTGKLF